MALLFTIMAVLFLSGKTQADMSESVTVKCGAEEMQVEIAKDFIPSFKMKDLRLMDPTCQPMKSENNSYFTIIAPLIGCGTTLEHTTESSIYRNVVKDQYVSEAIISRLQVLDIPIQCNYPNEAALPVVGMDIRQASIIALAPEDGSGTFDLEMSIFKNEDYGEMYSASEFPIAVSLQQRLYFQISVDTVDTRLGIVADACFATPVRSRSVEDKYDIITDGCPKDATVMFHDGPLTTQRFSFEAFQFVNGHVQPYVFIHCEVILCNGTDPNSQCNKDCGNKTTDFIQTRLKRFVPTDDIYDLEQGPIVFVREQDWADELEEEPGNEDEAVDHQDEEASNMANWLFVIMGFICIICLGAVLDSIRKMKKAKKAAVVNL